jgi:hypothetical protein
MNVRVKFVYDNGIITSINLIIEYVNAAMIVYESKLIEGAGEIIDRFTNKLNKMTVDQFLKVRELLGFIPFYNVIGDKKIYDPYLDFKTAEEFAARKSPVIWGTFLGVRLQQAFINTIGLTEKHIELLDSECLEHLLIDDLYIPCRDEIVDTLTKIAQNIATLTISDAYVFRFLGILYMINIDIIISGDRWLSGATFNDYIATGDLKPEIQHFKVDFTGADWNSIPDDIVMLSDEYRKISESLYNDSTYPKPAQIRALKVLAKKFPQ